MNDSVNQLHHDDSFSYHKLFLVIFYFLFLIPKLYVKIFNFFTFNRMCSNIIHPTSISIYVTVVGVTPATRVLEIPDCVCSWGVVGWVIA